jgi:DNA-binding HxlR family transcriptional regulator
MALAEVTPRTCSVARTLEVVGEKWALLAVREVFLGARKFEEMVANTGAPRDTLAARLKTLVAHGVLERRRYCERPPRDEYVLTEAGRDLYPVIIGLMQWGDKHPRAQMRSPDERAPDLRELRTGRRVRQRSASEGQHLKAH